MPAAKQSPTTPVEDGPWPRGIDSFQEPTQVAKGYYRMGINVSNRGGVVRTRPGFAIIPVRISGGVGAPEPPEPEPLPTGACCIDGTCSIQTEADCNALGGVYQGDGTPCDPNPCVPPPPPPTGACCRGGVCTIETQASCESDGGIYHGDDTTCSPNPCAAPPTCPAPEVTSVQVVFSGITYCGCRDNGDGTSVGATDFGVNGTFILPRINSTTFQLVVPSPGLFRVLNYYSSPSCGGTASHFDGPTYITAQCTGAGRWYVNMIDNSGIYCAFGNNPGPSPLTNNIPCGPDSSSGLIDLFHLGTATVT